MTSTSYSSPLCSTCICSLRGGSLRLMRGVAIEAFSTIWNVERGPKRAHARGSATHCTILRRRSKTHLKRRPVRVGDGPGGQSRTGAHAQRAEADLAQSRGHIAWFVVGVGVGFGVGLMQTGARLNNICKSDGMRFVCEANCNLDLVTSLFTGTQTHTHTQTHTQTHTPRD